MLAFVANNLQEEKNDVHVIGYLCKDVVPIFNKDINLHLLGTILKEGGHLRILRILYKIIKHISPDLIISFLTFPNLYSVILGKVLRIPVIISERGNPYVADGFKMKVIYNIINHADGAVFQTEGAKSFFSRRLQKKSVVIPNPVVKRNNSVSYDINCDNYDIVFVGRLENKQNI
jgi:UDP-N-acetylglucosamine:LPS N-acetylglucosamine transferase